MNDNNVAAMQLRTALLADLCAAACHLALNALPASLNGIWTNSWLNAPVCMLAMVMSLPSVTHGMSLPLI